MRNPLNSIVVLTKHIHRQINKLSDLFEGFKDQNEMKQEAFKILGEIQKSQFQQFTSSKLMSFYIGDILDFT